MFNRYAKSALTLVLLTFLAFCQVSTAQAYPMDNVFVRITDANGKAVSGGKVYVFTAGTTTPATTYSCYAMVACSNAHPVVADSGGKIAAIYLAAGSYKIRYTNSAGTTLYEVDNYVITDIDAINDNNFPVTAKTSDYTVVAGDDGAMFAVDASAAPGTLVTISAAAQTRGNGFPFCVVNSASTGTVTVTPDVGETINGAASYSLATQYQSACFVSRGAAGWFIYAERDPAGTFSTASTFNETVTVNDDVVAPPVTLTDAATIAWDMSTGTNFVVTLGGNRTLGAPTGETAGQFGTLRVIQDGTGGRTLTFNAAYAQYGGLAMRPDPVISATTLYRYDVRGADDVIFTRIWTSAADSIGIYKEYQLDTAFNDLNLYTQAHGLGRYPALVQVWMECTSTDQGWASGDRILVGDPIGQDAADDGSSTIGMNATNVYFATGTALSAVNFAPAGGRVALDETKWKPMLRVYE